MYSVSGLLPQPNKSLAETLIIDWNIIFLSMALVFNSKQVYTMGYCETRIEQFSVYRHKKNIEKEPQNRRR